MSPISFPAASFFRSFLIAVVAAFVLSWDGAATAQTSVRIVAANITSGTGQDYQAQGTRILQAVDADIVLIQEFNVPGTNDTAGVNAWVSSTFGQGYVWYREPGNQSIPNGIISRYPFVETGEWNDTEVPDRDFAWARIDVPGPKDLWAVSVHLKTSSATTQNTQVQLILNAMAAKGVPTSDYVVIGGDFNTSSRTAAPMTTLAGSSWSFATGSPWPVGEDGDGDTNAGRSSPYDWVVPNSTLSAIKTSTMYLPTINQQLASKSYANGLVMDTRDFTQSLLNEYFPPALVADSGASNMQHMAVVRTFIFPGTVAPPADGTVATVSVVNRAPAEVEAGSETPVLSYNVTVTGDEWDAASVALQRLGTTTDAQVTAKVYRDADNSGTVNTGDTFLGSSGFAGGSATVSLGANPPRAQAGTPLRLLVTAAVSPSATDGSTLQFRAVANGLASSSTGGTDQTPVFAEFTSNETIVRSEPVPPPPPVGAAVVVNKWFNHGSTAASDVMELLVVQDGLDMRAMIVKDFSSSMASDGGGKYQFSTNALWSSVRAGTLIVLRNNNTAADTSASGSDYTLDVGLANTTYFTSLGGSLDLGGTEMFMIKAAGSGAAGTASSIHALAGGTAGAQYTAAPSPKLNSTAGAGTGEYLYVTSTGASGDSRLANYADGGGTAAVSATVLTFGQGNNQANTDFINLLRGTTALAATNSQSGQFKANWSALTAASGYQLDVAREPSFSSFVAGYAGLAVGNVSSFTVDGLSDDTYYYRVRGVDADGTAGRNSNVIEVTVTTPDTPPPTPTTAVCKDLVVYFAAPVKTTTSKTGVRSLTGKIRVANIGLGGMPAATTTFYLSQHASWDVGYVILGVKVHSQTRGRHQSQRGFALIVPGTANLDNAYLIAVVEPLETLDECRTDNNTALQAASLPFGAPLRLR